MTERDDETRSVLEHWFSGEVRQAQLDLDRTPLLRRAPAAGRRRTMPPAALAGALISLLLAAGGSQLLTGSDPEPTAEESLTPSPTDATPTSAGAIGLRYADGIPQVIDGELVLRPPALARLAPRDASDFLLGGWLRFDAFLISSCPDALTTDAHPTMGCGRPYLTDGPGIGRGVPGLDGWNPSEPDGPVVLRVHRTLPLMAQICDERRVLTCEPGLLIEAVVWAGDQATAATPMEAPDVVAALRTADPSLWTATAEAIGVPLGGPEPSECPGTCPGGIVRCAVHLPTLSWSLRGSGISSIVVFPTERARVLGEDPITAFDRQVVMRDGDGDVCFAGDVPVGRLWVSVANVMVAVTVNVDGPSEAELQLVEAVRIALEQAAG